MGMRGSLIVISAPDPSLFSGGALVEGKESNQLHADAIKNSIIWLCLHFAIHALKCCVVFDSMNKNILMFFFCKSDNDDNFRGGLIGKIWLESVCSGREVAKSLRRGWCEQEVIEETHLSWGQCPSINDQWFSTRNYKEKSCPVHPCFGNPIFFSRSKAVQCLKCSRSEKDVSFLVT